MDVRKTQPVNPNFAGRSFNKDNDAYWGPATMKQVHKVFLGLASCVPILTFCGQSKAAVYQFRDNAYAYTVSSTTYTGLISGSFTFNPSAAGAAGSFTNVSVAFTSADFATGNTSGNVGAFTYTAGFATAQSGTTQTIYFYDPNVLNANGTSTRGVSLSLVTSGLTATLAPGSTVAFDSSTANDQFCNALNFTAGSQQGKCTSAKNNLTSAPTGSLYVPSPAIILGALPLLTLANRRRSMIVLRKSQRKIA